MGQEDTRGGEGTAPTPRRFRSVGVRLGMVGTLALALAACGQTAEARRCVEDATGRVVEEQRCTTTTNNRSGVGGYAWRYGGSVAGGHVLGGAPSSARASANGSSQATGVQTGGLGGGGKGTTAGS